jgi:drug/metabolite transporter (DMT)-like permease
MPIWFIYSLGAMLSFTAMTLILRKLTQTVHSSVIGMLMLGIVFSIYASIIFIKKAPIALNKQEIILLLFAALTCYCGNFCDFESIRLSPNPGYASAVKGAQLVFITLAAYFLFSDVTLSIKGMAGIALVLTGVVLLATS